MPVEGHLVTSHRIGIRRFVGCHHKNCAIASCQESNILLTVTHDRYFFLDVERNVDFHVQVRLVSGLTPYSTSPHSFTLVTVFFSTQL
jgi:hypothetical protein